MAKLRALATLLCAAALAACGLQGAPVARAARIGAMVPGHLAPLPAGVDTATDLADISSSTRALSSEALNDAGVDQQEFGWGIAHRGLQMLKRRRLKKKKKGVKPYDLVCSHTLLLHAHPRRPLFSISSDVQKYCITEPKRAGAETIEYCAATPPPHWTSRMHACMPGRGSYIGTGWTNEAFDIHLQLCT